MDIEVKYEINEKVVVKNTDKKWEIIWYEFVYYKPIRYIISVQWNTDYTYLYAEEIIKDKELTTIWFKKW